LGVAPLRFLTARWHASIGDEFAQRLVTDEATTTDLEGFYRATGDKFVKTGFGNAAELLAGGVNGVRMAMRVDRLGCVHTRLLK
jgi:hypothetical protein